jgi:hypothetical protein
MQYQLNISSSHYERLKKHLYPGDGLEAVAIALCGRLNNKNHHKLLVNEIVLIPYAECERNRDLVSWKTERIIPLLEKAMKYHYALVKIHSHPGGYEQFSSVDDESDRRLFSSIFGWMDGEHPHASAIMLPDGRIFGRVFNTQMEEERLSRVTVVGDIITIWNYALGKSAELEVGKRTAQAFGEGTFGLLKIMRVGVVGCSGTGSPVIEQLVRLGVGTIVIVDPDKVELKNLNRILNTTRADAMEKRDKVEVLKAAIQKMDLGTEVIEISQNVFDDKECLRQLAECDVIFGCVDSVDGRDLLNKLCAYYLIPYFDLGIKLEADGNGGISKIVGTVNYIQPGKSTLFSRGLYDAEDLKAAGLYRLNPESFPELVKNSYIKNINVNRPAVISVNMMIGSYAVNEFLNRVHPYKVEPPNEYAQSTIDLTEGCFIHQAEERFLEDDYLKTKAGLGDRRIFLDTLEFAKIPHEKVA